ncbi:MAG: hypothetical protein GX558_05905 [Clostridiales bacterium]|nr:hypothetical protein [Clostridiales bacterium]
MDSTGLGGERRAARRGEYRRVSVGGWIGTLLLSAIPGVNLVLWIIWAFSARRPSRRSYAQALLILVAVVLIAAAVCAMVWGQEVVNWAWRLYDYIQPDTQPAVN